jgi:hypothetical protein
LAREETVRAFGGDVQKGKNMSRSVTVVMRNLPLDFTNEEVAASLWATVGINADPQQMRTSSGTYSKQAFILLTDEDLCEFLSRNFAETAVLHDQKAPPHFVTAANPRFRISSVTVELPGPAEDLNRNGIRKLK